MFLQMEGQFSIDNVRNYPAGTVDQLRELLVFGVAARPDPNRTSFYDVGNSEYIFFIFASTSSSKIMLLAAWPRSLPLD